MQDKFFDYMMKLNTDSAMMAKHNADPQAAALEFGLGADDAALIAGGDSAAIRNRCGDFDGASAQALIAYHTPE